MKNTETHYERNGPAGAPVVTFSHSLFANVSMWDPQLDAVRDYDVLRYDTRGHGGTPPTQGEYDFEMLADDACRLLDRLEIDATHFVGLSMGGMIGQALAIDHPDRILSLVLCDTRGHTPAERKPRRADRIELARREGVEPMVEGCITNWFSERFARENPDTMDRVRAMIRGTSVDGLIGCSYAINAQNHTPRLHEVRVPSLIIVGEDDPGTPVSESEAMHALIPDSELVVLPEARHLSNVERPEEFNEALVGFLSRHAANNRTPGQMRPGDKSSN